MKTRTLIGAGLVLALILSGCGATQKTIITDNPVVIVPQVIRDTLTAVVHDTVVTAVRIERRDTVLSVQYFPKTKTVTVYAKPDTIRLQDRDTMSIVVGTTRAEKWGFRVEGVLYLLGALAVAAVAIFGTRLMLRGLK